MNEVEDAVREKLKAQGLLAGRGDVREMAECGRSGSGKPGLRERVLDQARRANADAQRADRLAELDDLLTKHPDVARILDLIEDVR